MCVCIYIYTYTSHIWRHGFMDLHLLDMIRRMGISWLARASTDTLGSTSRLGHRRSEDYCLKIVHISEHNRSNQVSWYLTNAAGDEHYTGYVERHFSDFLNQWAYYSWLIKSFLCFFPHQWRCKILTPPFSFP